MRRRRAGGCVSRLPKEERNWHRGCTPTGMKNIKKRLALKTETLRSLDNQQLSQVGGGSTGQFCSDTLGLHCRRPTGTGCEA